MALSVTIDVNSKQALNQLENFTKQVNGDHQVRGEVLARDDNGNITKIRLYTRKNNLQNFKTTEGRGKKYQAAREGINAILNRHTSDNKHLNMLEENSSKLKGSRLQAALAKNRVLVNSRTTTAHLQTLSGDAMKKHQMRGIDNKDGTYILYSKNTSNTFGLKRKGRFNAFDQGVGKVFSNMKQQDAKIGNIMENIYASKATKTGGSRVLTGQQFNAGISEAQDKGRLHPSQAQIEQEKTFNRLIKPSDFASAGVDEAHASLTDDAHKPQQKEYSSARRNIAKLMTQQGIIKRSEKLKVEFGGSDSGFVRQPYYNNTAAAFHLLGDSRGASASLVNDQAVADAAQVAEDALGITVHGQNQASLAMGLNKSDVEAFKELAVIANVIEDHQNGNKKLDPKLREQLKQRLVAIENQLDRVNQRDQQINQVRREFTQDIKVLSKSKHLQTLRQTRAELKKADDELDQLMLYKLLPSLKYSAQQAQVIPKGKQAEQSAEQQQRNDSESLNPDAQQQELKYRQQLMTDRLNASQIEKTLPIKNKREAHEIELHNHAFELGDQMNKAQHAYQKEARPMVEKYGKFGFKADPSFWEPGSSDVQFPALQANTIKTLDYARHELIPDLQQQLDIE